MNFDVTSIGNLSNEFSTGLSRIESLQNQISGQPKPVSVAPPAPTISATVWYKMPIVWVVVAVVVILAIIANK